MFDESIWDDYENIKAGTKLHDLWVDFKCPICWEYGENFQEIIEEVNYIDEKNLLWLEFEHFINIKKLDNNKIEVSIGKWEYHPSGEEHRISQISLLDEYWDLVDEYFFWVWETPIAEFDVEGLDEYEIIARCTTHWLWWRKIKND
jgi:desulfoferrodoxin (superoxide reductase-like protein)